jgi:hypothetical protein
VEFIDYMETLFLIFLGAAILFSIVTALFYIPANSVCEAQFVHVFANTCFCFHDSSHPNMWEVITYLTFM